MPNEHIFVYGTLRKESNSPMTSVLTEHCDYVSEGMIQSKLYEVDGYPGAVESGQPGDMVHGELHRIINPELLLQLDEYEECSAHFPHPHEYVRKQLPVTLPTNEQVQSWVYIYNHDVSQLTRIEHGDYIHYLKEHS